MTEERKFTPPTEFPAYYVDGCDLKVVILGVAPEQIFSLIGYYEHSGVPSTWTEMGRMQLHDVPSTSDLHDIPKRIVTWHNVYKDYIGGQRLSRSASDKLDENVPRVKRLAVYRIERNPDGSDPQIFVEGV